MTRRRLIAPRPGFSLVELLVVLVIIGVLAAVLMPMYLKGGKRKTPAGERPIESPMQRGQSVQCINNLQQLRAAYQLATVGEEEAKPQNLNELRGIPESMKRCPVGGQPYVLQPASGRIGCAQPGHERY